MNAHAIGRSQALPGAAKPSKRFQALGSSQTLAGVPVRSRALRGAPKPPSCSRVLRGAPRRSPVLLRSQALPSAPGPCQRERAPESVQIFRIFGILGPARAKRNPQSNLWNLGPALHVAPPQRCTWLRLAGACRAMNHKHSNVACHLRVSLTLVHTWMPCEADNIDESIGARRLRPSKQC